MFNKCILVGRLTNNPETSTSPSGTVVSRFTLAVNRRFKQDETDFLNIVTFNKTAEFVKNYFTKGKLVLVSGSIQTRTWEGQDGQKRYATDIIADEVNFCGSKNEEQSKPAPKKDEFMPVDTDEELPWN